MFTYALYPHAEGWQAAQTVAESYKLNQPLLAVDGAAEGPEYSFASVDAPNVIIETVKKAEDGDGVIVRMYESENSLTHAKLAVDSLYKKAYSCNLLEENESELTVENGQIDVTLKPYEIVTVRMM